MTKFATVFGIAALALVAGCEGMEPPSAANSAGPGVAVASVAPDSGAFPTYPTPLALYRIDKVTPKIASDAKVGWFVAGEGSPREVGGFVGSAVIEGLKGRFNGSQPVELEIDIRQFQPVVGIQPYGVDAVHRVKLDMILKDARTGEEVGRSTSLYMDLVALTGTAAEIARNAGRTPELRMRERINQISAAWAQELSCAEVRCPGPAIAAVPAPAVAEPVVAAAPAPVAPAPAPAVVAEVVTEEPATGTNEAEPENPISSFFARLAEAGEKPESSPAATSEETVASAPVPAPAPVVVAETAPEESDPVQDFFTQLLKDDAEEPVEEPLVETAAAEPAPAAPAPVAQAPAAEAPAPEADATVEDLFARLFKADDAETTETVVAAAPAAEAPAPVVVAAAEPVAPAPVIAPAPAPGSAPAPAPGSAPAPAPGSAPEPAPAVVAIAPVTTPVAPSAAPAQDGGVAQRVPPTPAPAGSESAVVAQSPFFRSPAGTVPTLPQQALLGRSQRANDPLRRRAGDVVLEISNLPAFWDGDVTSGGIWVALPYVPAYRRAVVTNPVNGRTVEANLFWRDPQAGGGSTLLSSAAAEALGVAPGQVSNLGVKVVAAD